MGPDRARLDTQVLGQGRSGVVYRARDGAGRDIVRKVFGAHGLTQLTQIVLLGARNPYAWDEHAVAAAFARRRILACLVPFWFGPRLRVAEATGYTWNEAERAFELHAEFIEGAHLPLRHPLRRRPGALSRELTQNIMRPLARHLEQSGFDGLVWQAGRGNPVAWNNFLRVSEPGRPASWVWIDLESGVPALAPLNPLELFRFYLPRSLHFRRPLFDDVDLPTLERYAAARAEALRDFAGVPAYETLLADIADLSFHQARWKQRSRLLRSIGSAHARGLVSADRAAHYRTRPVRWYALQAAWGIRGAVRRAGRLLRRVGRFLQRLRLLVLVRSAFRFLLSQAYRARLAQQYGLRRIDRWKQRGQMSAADHQTLEGDLRGSEAGMYMTDFGFHLAIKPFVKAVEWWVAPALYAAGAINGWTLAWIIVLLGPIVRTSYTLVRLVQASVRRRRRPWLALVVGALPVIGNLAFPVQLFYSGTGGGSRVGELILDDAFAKVGRLLPIWGGPDTGVEHALNRIPGWLGDRLRRRPRQQAVAAAPEAVKA